MPKTKPKIPRNIIIISLVALASGFGQDLVASVLPGYLLALGLSRAGIGLIDGLLQGTTSLFRFISGILSDKYQDRKFFVFAGYALSSVARPLIALASTFPWIAGLRIIDGVGKGTKDAPRDALVADSSPKESTGRSFGFHRLIDTAGSVLGPLAAAGLLFWLTPSLHAYRLIFALAAIPGAIALGLIWFGVKDPQKIKNQIRTIKRPMPWRFWIFVAAMTVVWLTRINDTLFLVRANDIGVPSSWIPVLFAGFTLLYALLSYPIGILSDRFGKWPFLTAGWFVLAAVEFGFAHNPNLTVALALFAGYGLFYALTEGSGRAYIADLVKPESRGSAYAIFYTFIGLATIVGGFFIGHVWDTSSPHDAFQLATVGTIFGAILLLLIRPKKNQAPTFSS
ncbi:MAG: MFS transporter [Patescibacteria group bacterium]|nr:MFS transporter [Patescibacteria group bacterium]